MGQRAAGWECRAQAMPEGCESAVRGISREGAAAGLKVLWLRSEGQGKSMGIPLAPHNHIPPRQVSSFLKLK